MRLIPVSNWAATENKTSTLEDKTKIIGRNGNSNAKGNSNSNCNSNNTSNSNDNGNRNGNSSSMAEVSASDNPL